MGIKEIVFWLSFGVVCVVISLAGLMELRLVTDERTDGQTD